MKLNEKDYLIILKYYNYIIPESKDDIKIIAESLISNNLCSCIKSAKFDKEIKSKKFSNTHSKKLHNLSYKKNKNYSIKITA